MSESKSKRVDEKRKEGPSSWSGTKPAEERPPLATETWDLSNRLRSLANDLGREWPTHRANLHQSIETPFAADYLPDEEDGARVVSLLWEVADALTGWAPWTRIRSASEVMRRDPRGIQERQAVAISKCDWALKAWRRVERRRKRGETRGDHQARLGGLRPIENRIAKTLIGALSEQEGGFRSLQVRVVRTLLADQKRGNASPVTFLLELCRSADVWRGASPEALKKSKKRHTGT